MHTTHILILNKFTTTTTAAAAASAATSSAAAAAAAASGRVFHNFTPYTERHIAFRVVRT